MKDEYIVFATNNCDSLADEIASLTKLPRGVLSCKKFADGERNCCYESSVRNKRVVLVSRIHMPYENMFELFLAVDAARRASAKEIICVIPYLPHARQERKNGTRTAIAARLMADFVEISGVDRILTFDMHSDAIEGFFKKPLEHLNTKDIFVDHIKANFKKEDICLCSPDAGGVKRVRKFQAALDCDMVCMYKERKKANEVERMELLGNVEAKHVIIVDDMIDTGGTLAEAINLLYQSGAKTVQAYVTHGLLSGDAISKIRKQKLKKLYVGDTVPIAQNDMIEVVSLASEYAKIIKRLIVA